MRVRLFSALLVVILGCGLAPAVIASQWSDILKSVEHPTSRQSAAKLPQGDVIAGLKEALATGTTDAIKTLGHRNGFWNNPAVRIPLPGPLEQAGEIARKLGMGAKVDAFQLSLNRAAEKAVPQVADIFGAAIRKMTLSDAEGILTGGDHAATNYFRRVAGPALASRIKPIVSRATGSVGVTEKYKQLMAGTEGDELGGALSLLGGGSKNSPLDLDQYVTRETLNGLFYEIGREEKAIRDNPAARTTDLLKEVFAGH